MNDLQNGPEPVQSEDKLMLVLAYLDLLCLIPFFVTKSEYVKWHAKQGLTLCIVKYVSMIVLAILTIILAIVKLGFLVSVLGSLFFLGILVIIVLAIIKALGGFRWRIPFVADLSDKFFK